MMIEFDIENDLRQDLNSNERLLWAGKPRRGILLRGSDIFLIPFSLLWGGFAVFWETSALTTNAPLLFKLWGIPFVLIGLYITVGRFFIDAQRRANTKYGITEDRIIIKSGIFRPELKSLNIKTLSDITLTQKKDNSGTITLGPADARYSMMQGMYWPGLKQAPKLEFIENAKEVYDKIVQLQRPK
jgi:Bacterial PH domain